MTNNQQEPVFDEHVLEIIKRAALAPVRLSPLSRANAFMLRMKVYRHRTRLMQLSTHELSRAASLITLKCYQLSGPTWELLVQPKNLGFEEAFLKAGILTEADEPPPLD